MAIVCDLEQFLRCSPLRSGFLIGLRVKNDVVVLGTCSPSRETPEPFPVDVWEEGLRFVGGHYPAGTDIVGWFQRIDKERLSTVELKSFFVSMKQCDVAQGTILLTLDPHGSVSAYALTKNNLTPSSLNNEKTVRSFMDKMVVFNLRTALELHPPINPTASSIKEQLQSLVDDCAMWLPRERIMLSNGSQNFQPTGLEQPPVAIELLRKSKSDWLALHPPTVTAEPLTTPTVSLPIVLDVVGVFCTDIQLSVVADGIRKRLEHQINGISEIALSHQRISSNSVHHFIIPTQSVPITVIYPHIVLGEDVPVSDACLEPIRRELHQRFALPTTRPHLRKSNRHWSPWKREPFLINPHISINPSGNGRVAMVTGSYAYYHYMQDKFDDKGWGCAYRSLQTIWSWYKYQGYTERCVPSHRQIQEALVDCGDKPVSFIGTTQWIGSIEVSNVLNHLLEVDSRIHHCPLGTDLSSTGQIFLHHFETQGTPIMIGGGVLAHTILGVDYDSTTGNIKFLILDPHYIGPDDIKLIHGKGCGWKSINFWDQSASYNMCMPIRPPQQI